MAYVWSVLELVGDSWRAVRNGEGFVTPEAAERFKRSIEYRTGKRLRVVRHRVNLSRFVVD